MTEIESYEFPLTMEDDGEIKRALREQQVFAPSFILDDEGIYDPLTYRRQYLLHHTRTILVADRNVVTRWLALINGAEARPEHRIAAAIMAFAQSSNILVEPNLSLYEAAATAGSDAANDELRLFRIADNLNTQHWAGLALGRIQRLPASELEFSLFSNDGAQIDFDMPLRRWRRNYIIMLKMAELELRGLDRANQLTELVRWMYDDFIIGGPGLIFSIYYLTPNSTRSGLLKSLRSIDRERALNGIRNASWDLTLLSDWLLRISRQKTGNILTLLSSLDRKLMKLANLLSPQLSDSSSAESFLRRSLMKLLERWGTNQSKELSELIEGYLTSSENTSRQIYRPEEVNIDILITEGEKIILDWKH